MSDKNASQVYVVFKNHSTMNEAKSKELGRPVYDDLEVIEIRFAANRQTVGVFPAHELCEWGVDQNTGIRQRITYAQKYPDQYKAFKHGAAQSASGTPIEELTFLTQGKRLELKALNIYTAEALAELDGVNLKALGMSGRELKNQAQAYLDAAASTSDVLKMAAEIETLKAQLAAKDDDKPKRGRPKAKADDNPFLGDDYDADTLKVMLMDLGVEYDNNASREDLAELVKAENDKMAKKKAA
jgi:hypothetical protein